MRAPQPLTLGTVSVAAGAIDDAGMLAAFSPNGKRAVTASNDQTARVWDARSGRAPATLAGHRGVVRTPAFSPDGKRVVTASYDKTARVWDAGSGRALATVIGHKDVVNTAAFSPDGQRVVTASQDKTARVWDAESGRALSTLTGHQDNVRTAGFSPDGKRVVTASWDGIRTGVGCRERARAGHAHRTSERCVERRVLPGRPAGGDIQF